MENHTLTAWMLYSEVEQDLMADGTSADFGRYAAAALAGTPAATASAAQCAATTAALSTFVINSPGQIGGHWVHTALQLVMVLNIRLEIKKTLVSKQGLQVTLMALSMASRSLLS